LSSAIEQIDSPSTGVAVAHLMIDRFQGVVDTFGYDPGDDLLRQIAGRLASGRRRTDTVARIGRADFIIVSQQNDRAAAAALGEQLIRRFDTPFRLLDQEIRLTASVGVVLVNESGSVGGALRDAEATVNKAKAFGGDRAELFEAQLRHQAAHRFGLEQTLSRAIENDDLRVVYQPILDLSTRSLVGFESLLRWNSPEEEALPATKIIEIAESTGQIARIGEFVLSEALAQVTRARLAAGAGSKLWVAVNLSTREFAITDPVERCASMLAESGVPVDALRFELTETAVMEDVEEAIAQLARLRDLGVKVALDDFGTGHSSLAYLSRLPVSSLKIDHSFVWSLTNAAGDLAILEAIVAMGKSLGIELCAEGIETDAQLAILERLGCDRGQGFLFSMPLEPDELLAYVAAGIAYAPNSEP
jgi:diguanylate cyclase (GGDEF)-like protein